jgi:hypothetical protein
MRHKQGCMVKRSRWSHSNIVTTSTSNNYSSQTASVTTTSADASTQGITLQLIILQGECTRLGNEILFDRDILA